MAKNLYQHIILLISGVYKISAKYVICCYNIFKKFLYSLSKIFETIFISKDFEFIYLWRSWPDSGFGVFPTKKSTTMRMNGFSFKGLCSNSIIIACLSLLTEIIFKLAASSYFT